MHTYIHACMYICIYLGVLGFVGSVGSVASGGIPSPVPWYLFPATPLNIDEN